MQVSKQRLIEMMELLTEMGKGSKLPADGLGLYLGDGRPGSHYLRSNELLALVHGMLSMHDLAESHQRMQEAIGRFRTGDISDIDPELLELAQEVLDEQAKLDS